jgi:hypothetical protein
MPRKLAGWAARKVKNARRETGKSMSDAEVVATIQREAKASGATLKNDGKGGLDPRLALSTFRKANWACENPDCPEPKNQLDLDHFSNHPKEIFADPKASKKLIKGAEFGKKDNKFLHCLCAACHNRVHDRERAIDDGKKPLPMRGE